LTDSNIYGQFHSYLQYVNRSLVQNHIIKVNDPEIAEQRWMKQME